MKTSSSKHIIKICTSCSCEKRFSNETIKAAEQTLGLKIGEENEHFSLQKTGCLSHCEEGPNVFIGKIKNSDYNAPLNAFELDGKVHTNILPHKFKALIQDLS